MGSGLSKSTPSTRLEAQGLGGFLHARQRQEASVMQMLSDAGTLAEACANGTSISYIVDCQTRQFSENCEIKKKKKKRQIRVRAGAGPAGGACRRGVRPAPPPRAPEFGVFFSQPNFPHPGHRPYRMLKVAVHTSLGFRRVLSALR